MIVPSLHTAPKRHLIKIRTFLKKIGSFLEIQFRLKGLNSTEFLEILHTNRAPKKFSSSQLKITFKHPNFVRDPF